MQARPTGLTRKGGHNPRSSNKSSHPVRDVRVQRCAGAPGKTASLVQRCRTVRAAERISSDVQKARDMVNVDGQRPEALLGEERGKQAAQGLGHGEAFHDAALQTALSQ